LYSAVNRHRQPASVGFFKRTPNKASYPTEQKEKTRRKFWFFSSSFFILFFLFYFSFAVTNCHPDAPKNPC
jgi:heme/copper-type cytochrome/quinol oxidase subunit 2